MKTISATPLTATSTLPGTNPYPTQTGKGKSSTQNCLSGKGYVSSQKGDPSMLPGNLGRKNRLWKIKKIHESLLENTWIFLSCCIWGILTRASSVAPVCLALEVTRKRLLKKGDSLIKTSGSSLLATKT